MHDRFNKFRVPVKSKRHKIGNFEIYQFILEDFEFHNQMLVIQMRYNDGIYDVDTEYTTDEKPIYELCSDDEIESMIPDMQREVDEFIRLNPVPSDE